MPLATGQLFNERYQIEELLGSGGFGAVYRALDTRLEEPVAIKEGYDTSPASQKQFTLEARLLFRLVHPNLPRVHDYFILPGQGMYLVMDYIQGDDLATMLERRGGPLPEADVLAWADQVCDALAYLHSQDPPVIHRDIKPANIRLTPGGRAMLVDFGIAKLYTPDARTTLGARAVTPGFSPPEQYGQGATDLRSDIYALGATLYCLLTGRAPSDSVDMMARVAAPSRPVRAVNPAVSEGVSAAVEKAMALDREARWGSMEDFRRALAAGAAGRPRLVNVVPEPAYQPRQAGAADGIARPPASASSPISGKGSTLAVPAVEEAGSQPRAAHPQGKKPAVPLAAWLAIAGVVLCLLAFGAGGLGLLAWRMGGRGVSTPTLQLAMQPAPEITQAAAAAAPVATQASAASQAPAATDIRPTAVALVGLPTETALPKSYSDLPPANPQPGETWTSPSDGMPMAYVPAGSFWMGAVNADPVSEKDEQPRHAVTLDGFWIDATEVTNAMYARCVQAGACTRPDSDAYDRADYADHPVTRVDWSQASAYCSWANARLPSEAEWEMAARGGQDGLIYPWGNDAPDCSKANLSGCTGWTKPVGSYAPNAYGLFDMAGNAMEWVQDWYSENYYAASPEANPPGPNTGAYRGLRGGSWGSEAALLRLSNRSRYEPGLRLDYFGFRCVR